MRGPGTDLGVGQHRESDAPTAGERGHVLRRKWQGEVTEAVKAQGW